MDKNSAAKHLQEAQGCVEPNESTQEQVWHSQLDALNALGESLLKANSVDEALGIVGQSTVDLVNAKRVSFAEPEPDGVSMCINGLLGRASGSEGMVMPISDAGLDAVFHQNQPVHWPDLGASPVPLHASLHKAGLSQAYSMPVLGPDSTTASLNVAISGSDARFEDYFSILNTVSRFLGATLQRIHAQRETQHAHATLIDENPMMTVLLDEDGHIKRVSQFGSHLFGLDASALEGATFRSIHSKDSQSLLSERMAKWRSMSTHSVDVFDTKLKLGNGQSRWVRQSARKTQNIDGGINYLVVCEDTHKLRIITEELKHQAKHDSLTGLQNRVKFTQVLSEAVQASLQSAHNLAVMFLDLDHFKEINDSLGHEVGDLVLCEIAERLKTATGNAKHVARIGGDEFVLLVPQFESTKQLTALAEQYMHALIQPIMVKKHRLQIGTSIGICCYPEDDTNSEDLIKNADIALYYAKAQGRNRCCIFSSQLSSEIRFRTTLENDLQRAIENNELHLVFQPQFRNSDKQPTGIETLVRWKHPTLGQLTPDQFIQVAEKSGQIESLTDWVLENSLSTIALVNQSFPDLELSVNVSAIEFSTHSKLLQRIRKLTDTQAFKPGLLTLELTETALLRNPRHACEIINQLNDLGVKIAIDDFGTGYASLNYLINLPISAIKIDRSFVSGVETDLKKQAVTGGIIGIANRLNVDCIAEGVETISQLEWLIKNACTHSQGFYFSRPLPEAELLATLHDNYLPKASAA